jgi:hypothetical protein
LAEVIEPGGLEHHEDAHGELHTRAAERDIYSDGVERSDRGADQRAGDSDRNSALWANARIDGRDGMGMLDEYLCAQ